VVRCAVENAKMKQSQKKNILWDFCIWKVEGRMG
jgi:hypothetical protein